MYSKNTLFMTRLVLIKNIPALIPREHLVNITSLEFIWNVACSPWEYSYEAERLRHWTTYQELMSTITTSIYPSLKNLFIVVENISDYVLPNPPGPLIRASTNEALAATLLEQPNRIFKDYNGQLRKLVVTYQGHLFRCLAETVEHLGLQDVNLEDGEDGRFFINLPVIKSEENMVLGKEHGYWVHGANGFLYYRDKAFL